MIFNDLLIKEQLPLTDILALRHTPRERELKKVLPWLAAKHPKTFNAFQQTQTVAVESKMLQAKYVASFIGSEGRTAVFVGLYKIGSHRPLTYEQFWQIPEYQELKKFGMEGFIEGSRPTVLWFDLDITDFYKRWQGKLVVEWPAPAITWARFTHEASFPIRAISEDSLLCEAMPEWRNCIWSWAHLSKLPSKWRDALREWRGVYYIYDKSDGKGYVGATYGRNKILGRWEHYEETGHGGNVLLRARSSENFVFSILERVSPDMSDEELHDRENTWKERLHTRTPFGLNEN